MPPDDGGGLLWFQFVISMSIRIFLSRGFLSKCQWIITKLEISLILWRSGLGLLTGNFFSVFDSYLSGT